MNTSDRNTKEMGSSCSTQTKEVIEALGPRKTIAKAVALLRAEHNVGEEDASTSWSMVPRIPESACAPSPRGL